MMTRTIANTTTSDITSGINSSTYSTSSSVIHSSMPSRIISDTSNAMSGINTINVVNDTWSMSRGQ